jgi:hypothetical protein
LAGGIYLKTRLLFSVITLAAVTGCIRSNTAIQESVNTELFVRMKMIEEANVGKTFWLARGVLLCEKPMLITATKCDPVEKNTRLQVDGLEQGFDEENGVRHLNGMAFYRITLADGRAGYVLTSSFDGSTTTIDLEKAAAECKRRGEPRVGMTAKQVEATCWGKPNHVDRLKTVRGTTDRYLYDQGRVILRNGIVTSVQINGTLR